jgi:hypothetical protein
MKYTSLFGGDGMMSGLSSGDVIRGQRAGGGGTVLACKIGTNRSKPATIIIAPRPAARDQKRRTFFARNDSRQISVNMVFSLSGLDTGDTGESS